MRIALDCSETATALPHGVASYVDHLVRGLAEVASPEDRFDLAFQARRWAQRAEGVPELDGRFHSRRLPQLPVPLPWTWGVDVFHALSPRSPRVRFRRQVVTFHDLYPVVLHELWESRGEAACRRHHRRWKRYLAVARSADVVICVSENTRKDLVAVVPEVEGRASVIPLGVEQDLKDRVPAEADVRSELRAAVDEPYLLHIGSFLPVRNLPRIVQAFAKVADDLPRARLLLAGGESGYDEREVVEAEVDAYGLGDRVLMLGVVTEDEKRFLLDRARGLVMFHLYAGFGLTVLEAMGMGTPVGASPSGALPETAGEAALYADAKDTDGMADAMRSMLTDDEKNRSLIAAGYETAKRYRWESTARATYELYRALA